MGKRNPRKRKTPRRKRVNLRMKKKTEKKEEEKPKEKKKKKNKIPDEGIFTEKELEALEKKIGEVERWRDEKVAEQEAQPSSHMPKLTVSLIKSKVIQTLDPTSSGY